MINMIKYKIDYLKHIDLILLKSILSTSIISSYSVLHKLGPGGLEPAALSLTCISKVVKFIIFPFLLIASFF